MSQPHRDGVASLRSLLTTGDDDLEHFRSPAPPVRFADGTLPLHHPIRELCKCGLGHTAGSGCLRSWPDDVAAPPEPVRSWPDDVAALPEPVGSWPDDVAAPPEPVRSWPDDVAAPPEPVGPALEPVLEAVPIEVASPTAEARDALPDTDSTPTPYAQYEALGLGAPAPTGLRAAKLIVSAYRVLGFSILTLIVVVLVDYITQSAFFYCSTSWVLPMSVTAGDEHVVSLQAQLVQQQDARDRLANELNHARRTIAAQQMFQAEFGRAIKSDLEGRKLALGRVRELAVSAANTRAAILSANDAFASSSRQTMVAEYAAGLIDRHTLLSDKFQLAQISTSNLALTERQATFETRAQELEAQARSLDAILANATATGDTALSYDVLRIKQEYGASRLDLARSIELRDTLEVSVERQDEVLSSLQQSAYLRALHDHAMIVSVPYRNLSRVSSGAPLYGCRLAMILCRHVGTVIEILPGEVKFRHPYREAELRGQMVEVTLDAEDAEAAADEVLFVGGKPVLF